MGETLTTGTVTPHLARLVLGHFRSGDRTLWEPRPHPAPTALLTLMCDTSFGADTAAMWSAIETLRRNGGVDELMAIARGEAQ